MTICIAASAEDRKKLVLAADQMITANIPIGYQFETDDVRKIYRLANHIVALTAGNALFAYEIIEKSKREILSNTTIHAEHRSIEDIVEVVRKTYQDFRRSLVVKSFLEPRGLSIESYYQAQQRLHQGVVNDIENQLVNLNIGVDLVIAGHNPGSDCSIFTITHPGVAVCHDEIGYVAVGTGAPHAMYHLIGSNYKKTMTVADVERLVREAKQKSEVAPGVGRETTVLTLPNTS